MFKNLGNLAELMKQAGRVQEEMKRMGEQLKTLVVEGSAGGGMVKVRANGKQEFLACEIEPAVFQEADREMLEDLIVAAGNQALDKARQAAAEEMSKAAGGLSLPGLGDVLKSLNEPG